MFYSSNRQGSRWTGHHTTIPQVNTDKILKYISQAKQI